MFCFRSFIFYGHYSAVFLFCFFFVCVCGGGGGGRRGERGGRGVVGSIEPILVTLKIEHRLSRCYGSVFNLANYIVACKET